MCAHAIFYFFNFFLTRCEGGRHMLLLIPPDILYEVVRHATVDAATQLHAVCRALLRVIRTREHWFVQAYSNLLLLQYRQTKIWALPIDWKTMLRMRKMSVLHLCRLALRAQHRTPVWSSYIQTLRCALDGRTTDRACFQKIIECAREDPVSYFYTGIVGGSVGAAQLSHCFGGVRLTVENNVQSRLMIFSLGNAGRLLSARRVFRGNNVVCAKQCATPRFAECHIVSALCADNEQSTNLAYFAHTLGVGQPHLDVRHLFPSIASTPNMVHDALMIYFLRAIEVDAVDAVEDVMRTMRMRNAPKLSRSHKRGYLCLAFTGHCTAPRPPFLQSTSVILHREVHQTLARALHLSEGLVHWGNACTFPQEHYFSVSLDIFMLYTEELCPRVYAWWVSYSRGYYKKKEGDMKRMLFKNGLPAPLRWPCASGDDATRGAVRNAHAV